MAKLGLQADSEKRAKKFIQEILETNTVYSLNEEGHAVVAESTSYEDEEGNPLAVVPFWSKSFIPYARKWGEGAVIEEISLEAFVKNWISAIHENHDLVGLNWDQHGIGYECEPQDLIEMLASADEGQEITLKHL